jgi:hypothetical protein
MTTSTHYKLVKERERDRERERNRERKREREREREKERKRGREKEREREKESREIDRERERELERRSRNCWEMDPIVAGNGGNAQMGKKAKGITFAERCAFCSRYGWMDGKQSIGQDNL